MKFIQLTGIYEFTRDVIDLNNRPVLFNVEKIKAVYPNHKSPEQSFIVMGDQLAYQVAESVETIQKLMGLCV